VVAALTTWALVVPQAIAYAQIADLPPQAGLFAAFAGLLGYALLGSSRQLIVSPTSSTAAITAALVAPVAAGDVARFGTLAAALAILVGLVLALLGLLHMGFVSRFISAGVQAGFMFGLGLTIIVGQIPKLLGVPKGDGDFFPQLGHLLTGWTTPTPGRRRSGWAAWPCCSRPGASPPPCRRPWPWSWPASPWSPCSGWPATGSRSSAGSRAPRPGWSSRRSAGTTWSPCCPAPWPSP